jgi:hypothetical protein
MLSQQMQDVVKRLNSDWSFVELFLKSRDEALEGLELSPEERRCLGTGDVDGLLGLGMTKKMIAQAMSGAHSPQCPALKQT